MIYRIVFRSCLCHLASGSASHIQRSMENGLLSVNIARILLLRPLAQEPPPVCIGISSTSILQYSIRPSHLWQHIFQILLVLICRLELKNILGLVRQ